MYWQFSKPGVGTSSADFSSDERSSRKCVRNNSGDAKIPNDICAFDYDLLN